MLVYQRVTQSFWHVKNANQVEPRLAPLSAFAVFLEHSYRIIINSNGLSSFVKMRFGKQHPNNSVSEHFKFDPFSPHKDRPKPELD